MKDQYVGDINDYLKYALLRRIQRARGEMPLFMAWMMTPGDKGRDGEKLAYLSQPGKYRSVDPGLFDCLHALVDGQNRSVSAVASAGVLPRAVHFQDRVPAAAERATFAAQMSSMKPASSLVFFDPDNGMEIAKQTPKHLNWAELAEVVSPGDSVIVYQHNGRPTGGLDVHFAGLMRRMGEACPELEPAVLRGANAGFMLGLRPEEMPAVEIEIEGLRKSWPGKLWLQREST